MKIENLKIEDKFAPFRKLFKAWKNVGLSYEGAIDAARFELSVNQLTLKGNQNVHKEKK